MRAVWLLFAAPLAWSLPTRIFFEPNHGQTRPDVQFLGRAGGVTVFVTSDSASFVLNARKAPVPGRQKRHEPVPETVVRMTWEGGSTPSLEPLERESGVSHYFPSKDSRSWRTHIPRYRRMKLKGIYPGIDLVFYSNGSQLEYDLVAAPGANPSVIRLRYDGMSSLRRDGGDLVLDTRLGEFRQRKPRVFQEIAGRPVEVAADYKVRDGGVQFELARYDRSRPLVIDPVLIFSTFLGGAGTDSGNDVATDASGASYVAGETRSANFPVLTPVQPLMGGAVTAFVTKINAAGTAIEWSTYFGSDTRAFGVAVDPAQNVYITGTVDGSVPAVGAFQSASGGGVDGFVAKLLPNGSGIVYSGFLGGSSVDAPAEIRVDEAGNAYVAGITDSLNYPIVNAAQSQGAPAAFVTKILAAGNQIGYSARLFYAEAAFTPVALAIDTNGAAYLAGGASTTNAIPAASGFQTTGAGGTDGFLVRYNPHTAGNVAIGYGTYFGGAGDDYATGVAVREGQIVVSGATNSTNFPTRSAFQTAAQGGFDAFMVRFTPFALLMSTCLGGSSDDYALRAGIAPNREAYVAGRTASTSFPVTFGSLSRGSAVDVFFTRFPENGGATLAYSTYLGGRQDDFLYGMAVDNSSIAHLSGETTSADFPLSRPLQDLRGPGDAYLTRLSPCVNFALAPTVQAVDAAGGSLTATITGDANCTWNAAVSAPWLTITSALSGTGPGNISYTVAQNTGPARSAVLSAAGVGVTVNQASGLPGGTGGFAPPVITAPPPDVVIGVSAVTFMWQQVAGADLYDLRVFNRVTGGVVFSGNVSGGASTTTAITFPDGIYTFVIRACQGGAADFRCGAFSTRNFGVSVPFPQGAPSIQQPQSGVRLTTSVQPFSWTGVAGATRYEMLLEDVAAGIREYQVATPDLNTVYSIRSSNSYRVRVKACSAACGSWSAPILFSAQIPAVPTVAPNIPSPPQVTDGNRVSVNFGTVPNADFYKVQIIQSNSGPGGGALTVAAGIVTAEPAVLLAPAGLASVLVGGCNGNGCGPNSRAVQVGVPGPNPAVPALSAPVSGTTVDGPTVTFTWNRVPGDDGANTVYRLYVQDQRRQSAALDVLTSQNFYGALVLAEGTRYDALVIANPGPNQVVGPAVGFNVRGNSAAAPTLVQPTHNSVLSNAATGGNVLLAWSPVPGASLYQYYVGTPGQVAAVVTGVTPGLQIHVPLGPINGQTTQFSAIARACRPEQVCSPDAETGWGPWSTGSGTNFAIVP
ncbi:MAG: hypothetical protein FJW39_08905 [Acidobacteria bacterium]|nr:hypothetical protein [Acidobacteriota bacterium]